MPPILLLFVLGGSLDGTWLIKFLQRGDAVLWARYEKRIVIVIDLRPHQFPHSPMSTPALTGRLVKARLTSAVNWTTTAITCTFRKRHRPGGHDLGK